MTTNALRTGHQFVLGWLKLLVGSLEYAWRGATPSYAYQSMVQLFCITRGWSNDVLAKLLSIFIRPYRLPPAEGVLGNLSKVDVDRITDTLRERGYYVFERRLPADLVARLVHFALTNKCMLRPNDEESARGVGPRVTIYNRAAPEGIIYDFHPEDLVNDADFQQLMSDPSIIAVAQSYLGTRPVLDTVNMWWMASFAAKADSQAAQFYHFDMAHIRWLKFFIYLTDVGSGNGPHCFVQGSHRARGIPARFLSRGYARISDDEVQKEYPPDAIKEFTGVAGTVLAEDTRGLHKGQIATEGDRLMLEFEFSISQFGTNPSRPSKLKVFHTKKFEDWVAAYPRLFGRWLGDRA